MSSASLAPADTIAAARPGTAKRMAGRPGFRAAADGLACLAIAVLMLRAFEVEGYMISTGSMAPALYGYHKRVVCPTCGEPFARGVAFDGSSALADDEDELSGGGRHVVCPNCGQDSIDVSDVPRNHGDQLLVLKHAYEFRPPRRWEVIVFRNPNHPTQAFVKRVAGLPGERIQVRDGDVYADGRICRKSLESQRAMRIPVFETDHVPPDDPARPPRWTGGAGWKTETRPTERTFRFASPSPGTVPPGGVPDAPAWLTYRHRPRSGGNHETAVRLKNLPIGFALPASPFVESVHFDPDSRDLTAGTLTAVGVVSADWERKLRDLSADPGYQAAIADFVARSKFGPITDAYAYNRSTNPAPNAVRDLMVAFRLRLAGEGAFTVEMTDGRDGFRLRLDTAGGRLILLRAATGEELRSAPLPDSFASTEGALVEMSLMDRQALVAIDGVEPFAPWTYDEPASAEPPTPSPVRLGAAGVSAEVRSLALYRDVYYTRGRAKNGVEKPYPLADDEFFVLGDNSPVSLDSRSWPDGAVPAKLLLGKPFVVHLPSRPGTLKLGGREMSVRIPDFGRMRYIR